MENIVLIVCDTLSAKYTSMYGSRKNTPFLENLSQKNVVFESAYADSIWTPPSHASIFSGKKPEEHGVNSGNLYFSSESIADILSRKGYKTYAYSNNTLISPELGFGSGFDRFRYGEEIRQKAGDLEAMYNVTKKDRNNLYSNKIHKYIDLGLEALKTRDFKSLFDGINFLLSKSPLPINHGEKFDSGSQTTNELIKKEIDFGKDPFFLFINYTEPHAPYTPPPKYAGDFFGDYDSVRKNCKDEGVYEDPYELNMLKKEVKEKLKEDLIDLYSAEVRYLDDQIREIYNYISKRSEDTIFIITSDHGESFGEGGIFGHQFAIERSMIEVPLIVAGESLEESKISGNISISRIHDIATGNYEDLEDLTEKEIKASYSGAYNFFSKYSDSNLEKFNKEQLKYLKNKSKSIASDNGLFIENTKLKNRKIKLDESSPDPDYQAMHKSLKIGEDTEGIDY